MSAVGPADYLQRIRHELDVLRLEDWPARRTRVTELHHVIVVTKNDLAWIDGGVARGESPVMDGATAACERACEVTSMLYAAGAPHAVWRHWAALAAFGMLLTVQEDEPADRVRLSSEGVAGATQYAALAGEWTLASALPRSPPPPVRYYAEHVVWALMVDLPKVEPPNAEDDAADVWFSFFTAVTDRHPAAATLALHTIAELHIDLFGDEERYIEWTHPLFDPIAAAGAAIARHRSLVTSDLSDLDRRYLEPGLAQDEPAPLYPRDWPEPSPVARPSPNGQA